MIQKILVVWAGLGVIFFLNGHIRSPIVFIIMCAVPVALWLLAVPLRIFLKILFRI